MGEGELVGIIGSLNGSQEGQLIRLEGDAVYLTEVGDELLSVYHIREKVLRAQVEHLWKKPWLTTDGVILKDEKVVLIKRGKEPFKGLWALPGGIVEYGERVEDCVVREVREETGLQTRVLGISGVYSDPERDPRGHFVTIAFNLEVTGGDLRAGDDAAGVGLHDPLSLPDMAADHREIIEDALRQRGHLSRGKHLKKSGKIL
ncbi:MAG: NUDIX hydrolase [Methanomassiliicoccales archaeon]|nr:MAG: NUDIX hydrolase [Methanomassiliicoccales archaeon]